MKRWRLILIGLVVLGGLGEGWDWLRARRAASIASEWQACLESCLSSPISLEDARECLETAGFQVVRWNPHIPTGWIGYQEELTPKETRRTLVVLGSRRNESFWPRRQDRWLWATVHFDLSREYLGVEVDLSPIAAEQREGG